MQYTKKRLMIIFFDIISREQTVDLNPYKTTPPSTLNTVPVINPASSEARKA